MAKGYAIEEALRFYITINKGCGMTKKTHVWLMRWLKEMGAHEN
jgi:hypothetical protein